MAHCHPSSSFVVDWRATTTYIRGRVMMYYMVSVRVEGVDVSPPKRDVMHYPSLLLLARINNVVAIGVPDDIMDDEWGAPDIHDIRLALRPEIPKYDRDVGHQDEHIDNAVHQCVNCQIYPKVIARLPLSGNWISYYHIVCKCVCGICVYCSEECKQEDYSQHQAQCYDIVDTIHAIYEHIRYDETNVEAFVTNVEAFVGPYGRDSFDTQSEYAIGEGSKSCWKDYFLLRQELIEQLIDEGIARADSNGKMIRNELALNTAIFHCEQLFILDKDDSYHSHVVGLLSRKEILMNLYLITGRYQELYNTCCFYASKGEETHHLLYRHHHQYGLHWALDTEAYPNHSLTEICAKFTTLVFQRWH
jgi:hypothetical protein